MTSKKAFIKGFIITFFVCSLFIVIMFSSGLISGYCYSRNLYFDTRFDEIARQCQLEGRVCENFTSCPLIICRKTAPHYLASTDYDEDTGKSLPIGPKTRTCAPNGISTKLFDSRFFSVSLRQLFRGRFDRNWFFDLYQD